MKIVAACAYSMGNLAMFCYFFGQRSKISKWADQLARSFIVGPHSQHTNDPFLGEYLIHNAVLDVDAAGVSTG